MGCSRLGLKFGMKLHTNEPRVLRKFSNFNKVSVWVNAAKSSSLCLQFLAKSIVKFIAVPMALENHFFLVGFSDQTVL